jgi:putative ABC transport system permease protein
MKRPRWNKVIADLWENKARSLMIILSISVGVFAVGMVGIGYYLIPEGIHEVYSENIPENITIVTDYFDEGFIDTIRDIDDVMAVEGEQTIYVRVRSEQNPLWESFQIVFSPNLADRELKKLTPVEGNLEVGKREIILLSDHNNITFNKGETLEVLLSDGTIRKLIMGASAKNYTAGIDQMMNTNVGFLNSEDMTYLNIPPYFTTLYIAVDNDGNDLEHIQEVTDKIIDQIEDTGKQVYNSSIKKSNTHPFDNYITAIAGIMGVVGLLIILLSGSLIYNTMNALVSQQLRQIGVMKLIGARREQVITMYIMMVIIFGLIALLFAIPSSAYAGYKLSETITPVLNGRLNQDVSSIPIVPPIILIQVIVALIIPIGAALLPVLDGSRITVQQALSGSMINQRDKVSFFDKSLKAISFLEGIPQLSLRNTFRRKGRLILTLFTLALGGAILIAVFNVQLSLNKQIDRIISYNGGDIFLTFSRPYPICEIENQLMNIPEIEHVESWLSTYAILYLDNEIENVNLLAPPPETILLEPSVLEGRWVEEQDERAIVVNESFLDDFPNLSPGDQIILEIHDKEQAWTITGIFHYTGMDEKIAFTNTKSLSKSLKHMSTNAHFRILTKQHTSVYQKKVSQKINNSLLQKGYQIHSIYPINDFLQGPFEKLDLVIYVLLILAILTSLVGSIGLSGTLSLNVLERTSEIGILRAIGAYNRIISQLIIIEGLIIGVFSYLLALILSIPMNRLLTSLINNAIFGVKGNMAFTSTGFIVWALILLLFSIISSLIPARNATRLTIREVLAYE